MSSWVSVKQWKLNCWALGLHLFVLIPNWTVGWAASWKNKLLKFQTCPFIAHVSPRNLSKCGRDRHTEVNSILLSNTVYNIGLGWSGIFYLSLSSNLTRHKSSLNFRLKLQISLNFKLETEQAITWSNIGYYHLDAGEQTSVKFK